MVHMYAASYTCSNLIFSSEYSCFNDAVSTVWVTWCLMRCENVITNDKSR